MGQHEALARFFDNDWPLSTEELTSDGSTGLESHIDRLSTKYGYPVLYSEQVFQQATQILITQQDLPGATDLARLYVRQYAGSPTAHFLLGVTLARGGERAGAVEAMETTIGLYEADPQADLRSVYEQAKQVLQQLGG